MVDERNAVEQEPRRGCERLEHRLPMLQILQAATGEHEIDARIQHLSGLIGEAKGCAVRAIALKFSGAGRGDGCGFAHRPQQATPRPVRLKGMEVTA